MMSFEEFLTEQDELEEGAMRHGAIAAYGATSRHEMVMDLQQRPPQHGHRRHHTRHETEPVPNGRVVLVSNSPTNGGITEALWSQIRGYNDLFMTFHCSGRDFLSECSTFKID